MTAIQWAAAAQLALVGACEYMPGFSKGISLLRSSPIHTNSRCTSRAAAKHPQMLVDSARAHFRSYESERFAVRSPRFAARPLRSVVQHCPPPASLSSRKVGWCPERLMSILTTRMSPDSSASISNCAWKIAAFKLASTTGCGFSGPDNGLGLSEGDHQRRFRVAVSCERL